MVAQVMSQGVFGQLLQSSQEPEEFIALEELRPRLQQLNRNRNLEETSISETHLYPQPDLQSYYNLSPKQQ